ncbi:coniferyl aldehyde dehydrogenase [Roseovarius sp. SCSIO 43702]|uniref:coniferyl aldehyde dehydrogenase n=1 Tax=Roseovarius sp. SCSIO 43702 TaxID=2823043 RepID=UPI001C73B317|nr:coniferyl aldehyde dehydrogenase [Roseovarius sp. SCSIO 43702]QYX57276.1 coniferyl aldehyde dehydrogenase [Roseovarius sp. SCSIO 43702]
MKDEAHPEFPAFDTMRKASRRDRLPELATRKDRLSSLRRMVVENRDEIARVIDTDFGGRPRKETELLEIVPLLNTLRNTSRHLGRWMRDERRHVAWPFQPGSAWVRHEPLGVVGIISPWNYPLLLALGPLVDVLGAGNRAMIKPSELTPGFSELLKRLVSNYFDADVVTVETGGVEVAQAFSALPFDHLIFTGSTAVGRKVMQAAAANLTPVTLELGGKSPAVVAPDYPLDKAARSIVLGKFTNAGQTCIAPDYVLVPEGKAEALARQIIDRIESAYPAARSEGGYADIITARHRNRLVEAVEEAREGGATILRPSGDYGDKIAPTLVIDAPGQCLLLREEIFGPILPIVTYGSLDEALAFINRHARPLALYAFTDDRTARGTILDGAISGGVTLNGTLLHIAQDDLPFGGVGDSGIGAYHGRDGFRRMSHARSIYKPGFFNAFEVIGPPFGKLADFVIRVLGR